MRIYIIIMPHKKFKKKHFKKGHKGSIMKRSAEVMVNKTPMRLHQIVAPHYYTKLTSGFCGTVPALNQTAAYGYISLNSVLTPNAPVGVINFTSVSAVSFNGTLTPATVTLAALQPAGYTALLNLYRSWRVYASEIHVTLTPSVSADTSIFGVIPFNAERNTFNPSGDVQRLQSQPYSKFITVTGNNNIKQNTISMFMDCKTLLGQTKQQYQDDPNNIGKAAIDPVNILNWQLVSQTYNRLATAAIMNVEVRTVYSLEFFEPNESNAVT